MPRPISVPGQMPFATLPGLAAAEVTPDSLQGRSAPDRSETRIGTLEFTDGALDFTNAPNVQ